MLTDQGIASSVSAIRKRLGRHLRIKPQGLRLCRIMRSVGKIRRAGSSLSRMAQIGVALTVARLFQSIRLNLSLHVSCCHSPLELFPTLRHALLSRQIRNNIAYSPRACNTRTVLTTGKYWLTYGSQQSAAYPVNKL